ncbi:MAG: TIR domain-containing protein [Rhodomicrobium sp.]
MGGETDVFISYSSKDVAHAEALEALLEKAGLTVWRDKKRLAAGDNYVFSIHDGIANAKRVVVLWSPNSIASDYVIAEAEYARNAKKLIPVALVPCTPPVPFNVDHALPLSVIATAPEILLKALSGSKEKDGTYRVFSVAPEDIDTSRLPKTFSPELFGREIETAQLFDAWHGGKTHIVALDAIGGTGKTALVSHFIQLLKEGGWRGAQRVFVWSFYSQGTDENRQGDADPFYIAALTFFGFERDAAEAEARNRAGRTPTRKEIEAAQLALIRAELPSPAEKGRALTRLVRERRTLLFLDGMEPLQYPAGRNGGGKDETGVSGMLKDKGMALLLRELAADNRGLVIVTTRIKLKDLKEFRAPGVLPIALTALLEAPAVELLKARGVMGSAKHLAKLANDLRGHALALNLVARYLVTHHGGDARRADLLPDLAHVGGDDERDPYRVMSAYEIEFKKEIARELGIIPKWARKVKLDRLFKTDTLTLSAKALSTAAGRQLALLYMLGLFDQPVPRAVLDALIAPPAIAGLTDGLLAAEVRTTQWNEAIARLRDQGLISPADADAPGALDCHPLVREYFGQRLAQIDRTAFKAAHSRLYEYYRYGGLPAAFREPVAYGVLALVADFPNAPYKEALQMLIERKLPEKASQTWPPVLLRSTPDQLREAAALIGGTEWNKALDAFLPGDEAGMNPLFSAIAHGCAAEREDEAWSEVYRPRIAHGNEFFAARRLGLFSQELAAAANFFEAPFMVPSSRLAANLRVLLLNLAGTYLQALGRLGDAAPPMRKAIKLGISQDEKASNLARGAGSLSELLVAIGQLSGDEGAETAGKAAVAFADRSCETFECMFLRAIQADASLQVGALACAEALFHKAEELQKERQPGWPRIYSLAGYRYCDLLLARGRTAEAAARAFWVIEHESNSPPLDNSLYRIAQVRAVLTSVPPPAPAPQNCSSRSDAAVTALRRVNAENHLPRGLLAHAEALWRCGDANAAGDPLSEAEDIAARGPMPLFLTQAHLLRARIALSQGDVMAAHEKRKAAAFLIEKHDYGRGAVELAVLDAEIACAANVPARDAAINAALSAIAGEPYHDARTSRTISGGWFGLLPRLEAILPAGHAGLAQLQAARDAYNAERDDYLRSTLAKDVKGYDPEGDPIAAYLAQRDAGGKP